MDSFGTRLRHFRENKKLTQTDLASRLRRRGFGTTQTTVSRWEDSQIPRGYVLSALAEELGVTVDDLLGSEDEDERATMPASQRDLLEALHLSLEIALGLQSPHFPAKTSPLSDLDKVAA